MYRISVLVAVTAILAGCGGGSAKPERVLHLRTGDYTEYRLRAEIRVEGLDYCTALKGLNAQDVLDIINVQFDNDTETPTSRPVVQASNPADDLRQAQIIIEECARIK